jgi:8-oxo-dGTP pyrophosphatase MutT (NUDIX family)
MHSTSSMLDNLRCISPYDLHERQDISNAVKWLESYSSNTHFVSYSPVFDEVFGSLLLVRHRKTHLWLPCGGHIESMESPKQAAIRELHEELGITPRLIHDKAYFVSTSAGEGSSLHVNFWFSFQGKKNEPLKLASEEILDAYWFGLKEVPLRNTDPQLSRFLEKVGVDKPYI